MKISFKNTQNILKKIYDVSYPTGVSLYIVGGFIRDMLLKPASKCWRTVDIDLSGNKEIINIAKMIASKFDSKYIILDKKFSTIRVILKDQNGVDYQLDFTEFKGKNIQQDLLHRDFTINSLAIEVEKFIRLKNLKQLQKELIFPSKALKDLEDKKIVPVTSTSFKEDPLRIVRTFSIGAYLGFEIPKEVLLEIKKYTKLLDGVSQERVRDELFRLFSTKNSYSYIKSMADYGVLDEVFPELRSCKGVEQGPYHHLDIYYHSIECVKEFESLLPRIYKNDYLKPRMKKFLDEKLADKRNRMSLIKLALLYHDIGKPEAKEIEEEKIKFWGHEKISKEMVRQRAEIFKLSNLEKRSLENMVYYHLRPGNLVEQKIPTKKATYRFFRHAGEETPATILVSIADKYATAGELITKESMENHENFLVKVLKEYFHIKEKVEPKKLIDGNDVMKILNIGPSKKVGKILEEIKVLQMEGRLKNRKEALGFIKNYKS